MGRIGIKISPNISNQKSVLVTGGAGFIGSHLVDRLVSQGYTVRVVDNLYSGQLGNIKSQIDLGKVDFVQGDIRDPALMAKCVEGVDAVVHLAALTSVPFSVDKPDLTFDVNVSGSLNLMNACIEAGVGRFVFASSCAVFGDTQVLPVNEQALLKPISPYADSKLAIERCCRGFNNRGVLGSVVLRFFNVFGPRQGLSEYSGVITLFANRCRQHLPLIIYGDGLQTRDFVSVYDVVEGIFAAMIRPGVEGEAFNIGSGKATSIDELAQVVMDLAGVDLEVRHEKPRLGDIKDSYADISKAKRLLGFEPKVSLREGLKAIV